MPTQDEHITTPAPEINSAAVGSQEAAFYVLKVAAKSTLRLVSRCCASIRKALGY
jgi:hypothetical protein